MPRLLPVLAAAAIAPLLGLTLHVAAPAHGTTAGPDQPAAVLPNNLCASCHGGGRVMSRGVALSTSDLAMRSYLQASPQE